MGGMKGNQPAEVSGTALDLQWDDSDDERLDDEGDAPMEGNNGLVHFFAFVFFRMGCFLAFVLQGRLVALFGVIAGGRAC